MNNPVTRIAGWLLPALLIAGYAVHATAATKNSFPPKGNGIWMYDSSHNGPSGDKGLQPGMWVSKINAFNRHATKGHRISVMFSYAADMEMYCPGKNPGKCTLGDLDSYYFPPGMHKAPAYPAPVGQSGYNSTSAYAMGVKLPKNSERKLVMSPIIDARMDRDYDGSLKGFTHLSPRLAKGFADKISRMVCSDNQIDGIQFDLEPLNLKSKNGQYYFYMEIARNFAGQHDGNPAKDPYHCVDSRHPHGRFFSIFTFAKTIKVGTESARNTEHFVNKYGNGIVIDSLYDLSQKPGGYFNPVSHYTKRVDAEVANMKKWANAQHIRYGFGIPAAATAHEYASCHGPQCHPGPHGKTGAPIIKYTKAAIHAIDENGVRQDPRYMGTNIWFFGPSVYFKQSRLKPTPPPQAVLKYLQTHL